MPVLSGTNGVGARKRRTRAASVLAALALTGAGFFGLSGEAQAEPVVTVHLTAQGVCHSNPDRSGPPVTTLATANITHFFQIIVSGTLTGLKPGHQYDLFTANSNLASDFADLGKADANGNLTVTNVVDDGGASGYTGTSQDASIYDYNDGRPEDGAPVGGTVIPIADNCSRLIAGSSHDRLVQGTLRLIQQGDGNLVLYQGSKPLWFTKTGGNPGAVTVLQGDGNLVVYAKTGKALWSSRTNQKADSNLTAALILQGDKNLVLYERTPVSKVLWATYTN